jgi:hypothetical protein
LGESIKGFIEGFKRFDSVTITKAFGARPDVLAYITFLIDGEKMERYAYIREPELESYTTITEDCTGTITHERKQHSKVGIFTEETMLQFFSALKDKLPVNLVIAVVKTDTRRYEFVSSAEFM